jgi:hypothetical protein
MVAWTPPFGGGEKESSLGSENVGWDLTPIGIMVRGVDLPLPCREGHGGGRMDVNVHAQCETPLKGTPPSPL